jgi:hypothetical protein
MNFPTRNARLLAPLQFQDPDGTAVQVPAGECLIEQVDDASVDVIWGAEGENSITVSLDAVKAAAEEGTLVLVD